jgi:putative transposase
MLELARERPRFGYRRIAVLLQREGYRVNVKRVYRLWLSEGLRVPKRTRKRRALGNSGHACHVRRAMGPNDVWCWDFIFDRTVHGQSLKWLSIVDEYTRRCICLDVSQRIRSEDLINRMSELFVMYGAPKQIRSDNGPEFIAKSVQSWVSKLDVGTLYVEPGSPWENGYAESFHSRLGDELLRVTEFENLSHARSCGAAWREDYNDYRPHSSLGGLAASECARRCAASGSAAPPLQQHSDSLLLP